MTAKKDKPAAEIDKEQLRQVMSDLGSRPSAKRDEARAKNALKGGRPVKPLREYPCTCGAGDTLEGHKTNGCPRGYAIWKWKREGRELIL